MHTYCLTCSQSIIYFYMMGLGANFTMTEVAPSANNYANCHYNIFSVSLIPVYRRIWYFPMMDVKRGGEWGEGGVHVSKERGMKKKGANTPFRTMFDLP